MYLYKRVKLPPSPFPKTIPGLNIIRSAVKWGVIESDDADLDMLDGLGINGKNIIPASLVPTAQVFSKKFMNNINLIDVGIVCDSEKSKNV